MHQKPPKIALWLTKIGNWEFWPFEIVYAPIALYYLWLSLKARSFFFFSASNPSIETGGMIGESKISILDAIPENFKPVTLFISKNTPLESIVQMILNKNLSYPIIAKPDVGERGTKVEMLSDEKSLAAYVKKNNLDFIIQEYIDFPIEMGIFYYRFPTQQKGVVSSIVIKDFLQVKGDGISNIGTLISNYGRASLQYERLKATLNYDYKPKKDERILLEPIGNHCRGTTFLDGNYIIDESLTTTIDNISKTIPGFYYGRYDLKCKSIDDLKIGKNIKIMELNGAGAEPSHIYDPKHSIFYAWKILFFHWNVLYKVSVENHKRGIPYMHLKEARQKYNTLKKN